MNPSARAGKCSPGEFAGQSRDCVSLARGPLTFLYTLKEQFVNGGEHNCGWQVFQGPCVATAALFVRRWSGTFLRRFGRSGFRLRLVSGSHAEGKRPMANPLELMYENRPRTHGEILFLVRCCLTPMSDRVFSWKGGGGSGAGRLARLFSLYWLKLFLSKAQLNFFSEFRVFLKDLEMFHVISGTNKKPLIKQHLFFAIDF